MEIPTEEIIEQLDSRLVNGIAGPVALEAIDTIKAQALEIKELQLVIVRLRDNLSMSDRDYLELVERHNNG